MAGLSFNVHETIDPLCSADEAAITLLTTNKALIPTARYNLGTQYFNKEGRKLKIAAFGKMTTGATPGNLVFELLFGTNADANGASLCASAAITLIASQTNIVWGCEFYVQCRSKGAAGTLFGRGWLEANPALIASTAQPIMIPPSAPVVSAAVDLTGVLVPSLQARRSGSTAETITVQDFEITPMS
jgi:hypothetical protein